MKLDDQDNKKDGMDGLYPNYGVYLRRLPEMDVGVINTVLWEADYAAWSRYSVLYILIASD